MRIPSEELPVSTGNLAFGFLPTALVHSLCVETDWRKLSMGVEALYLSIANAEDIRAIVSDLPALVNFLSKLLADSNFKIVMTTSRIFAELLNKIGPAVEPVIGQLITEFVDRFADTKLAIRQASAKLLLQLMYITSPECVIANVLQHTRDIRPKVREESVNMVTTALLTFPQASWDLPVLIQELVPTLHDEKAKVKYVVVEAYTVIAASISPGTMQSLLRDLGVGEETLHLLDVRFMNPSLPILNSEGLLEHIISRSSVSTPQPLTPSQEISFTPPGPTRANSKSAPSAANRQFAAGLAGAAQDCEEQYPGYSPKIERAYSALDHSPSPVTGAKPRGQSTRTIKLPWERPKSGRQRNSFHEDVRHGPLETFQRARSFSDSERTLTMASPESVGNSSFSTHSGSRIGSGDATPVNQSSAPASEIKPPQCVSPAAETPVYEGGLPTAQPDWDTDREYDQSSLHSEPPARAFSSPQKKKVLPRSSSRDSELPASAPPDLQRAPSKTTKTYEAEYRSSLQQLRNNPDWDVKVQALEQLKALLSASPNVFVNNFHELILAVIATIQNLRSSVAKQAISFVHSAFQNLGKAMEADLDMTVGALLKKAGEGTGFIVEETDRALEAMCTAITPTRAVASLLSHFDHKNPAVRMRVSCLLYRIISELSENQVSRYLQSFGDAGKLLNALVCFLREGAAETRKAAKRLVLFLAGFPDFNKTVDKVLAIKQANEIREALKGSSVQDLAAKTAPPISRTVSKRNVNRPRESRDARELDKLVALYQEMVSDDWKRRFQSVLDTVEFVKINAPEIIADRQHIQHLMDKYLDRCRDGNSKVALLSLQHLVQMIQYLKGAIEPVTHLIMQTLANQLAASSVPIRTAAIQSLDALTDCTDNAIILQSMANIVQFGTNPRAKPLILERMIPLVQSLYLSKPTAVTKYAIPTALRMLSESKGDIKLNNTKLLQGLFQLMGPAMYEHMGHLSPSVASKINKIVSTPL
ncbi:armadillo-type protein [Phlyctochytrium arcticum]|nr:armadillo-type protein [Phlyctochytrium arcticum]